MGSPNTIEVIRTEHPEWVEGYRAVSSALKRDRYNLLKAEGDPTGFIQRRRDSSLAWYYSNREKSIERQRNWRANQSEEERTAYLEKHRARNREYRARIKAKKTGTDLIKV